MERAWYSNVWIGLNDLNTKGVYEWSDGSPVSWTNWYVGQPDERRTDKTCVYMSLRRAKRGWMYWNDQNCTNKYAFICTYRSGKFVSMRAIYAIIIALVDELLSSLLVICLLLVVFDLSPEIAMTKNMTSVLVGKTKESDDYLLLLKIYQARRI
jgi:hypothetical protein